MPACDTEGSFNHLYTQYSIYQPNCIILFGAVARNTQQRGSDIDILVIGKDVKSSLTLFSLPGTKNWSITNCVKP